MNFITICSAKGEILYASGAVHAITGYKRDELVGHLFTAFVSDNEVGRVIDTMIKVKHEPREVIHQLRHRTGRLTRAQTTFHPVADGSLYPKGALMAVSESLDEVEHIDQLLQILAMTVSAQDGENFFHRMIMQIAMALRVDYAFVTVSDAERQTVTMLSFWKGNRFVEGVSYPLQDTPCDAVINEGKMCYYPLGVQGLFPKDVGLTELSIQGYLGVPILDADGRSIGHLAILHRQPLNIPDRYHWIMRIFADRAAAFLETMRGSTAGAR